VIFSLDVRRARKGDCLLLHYGDKNDPGLVLIDGGPALVYQPHLAPRLAQIRQARGLGQHTALPIDLLMVSHIDDDHINGILELTRDLVNAKDSGQPRAFRIKSFWHNTFDDIIGNKPDELLAAVTASYGPAALTGDPDTDGLDSETAMVLASVAQGRRLRDDARKLELRNREFGRALVMATASGAAIPLGKGLELTVAGPMKPELVKLRKEHDVFLKKQKKQRETEAALAAFTDRSAANLSSIVVLAEVGGKRMLLTGDARGDKVLKGLELVKVLKKKGTLHVDVLKLPHHGSDRNVNPGFFRRVTADHYVFSGNGEHGNPERAALQMLLDERGQDPLTIHLTYPVEEIDVERKKDWEKEQRREKDRKKKDPKVKLRPNWSAEKHGLKAFFAAHQAFAKKVRVVQPGTPHVIDLLDPVGF
jgi:hypothetical protein